MSTESQERTIPPRCLPVKQAAFYIGISPSNWRSLVARINFPTVRIGGRVLFDRYDLDALVDRLKNCSTNADNPLIKNSSNSKLADDLALDAFGRLA